MAARSVGTRRVRRDTAVVLVDRRGQVAAVGERRVGRATLRHGEALVRHRGVVAAVAGVGFPRLAGEVVRDLPDNPTVAVVHVNAAANRMPGRTSRRRNQAHAPRLTVTAIAPLREPGKEARCSRILIVRDAFSCRM